jgi:hypothetical protein
VTLRRYINALMARLLIVVQASRLQGQPGRLHHKLAHDDGKRLSHFGGTAMRKRETARMQWLWAAVCCSFATLTATLCAAQAGTANPPGPQPRYVASLDQNGRKNGTLIIPKSRQFIAERLTAISRMPVRMTGEFSRVPDSLRDALKSREFFAQQEAGLRALAAYRFLCDVPYDDLEIDRDYAAHALAGARLLTTIGMLNHKPDNPGWPDDEYQFALKGTSSSNICTSDNLPLAMEIYMGDSDAGNVDRLGHRRWCLNPAMLKTGFGAQRSGYSCMWSMDFSRKNLPDFDFVAYPPRGLMPTSYFKSSDAWSLSLNPKKFQKPDASVKASVAPVRFDPANSTLQRGATPLEIESIKVSYENFGIGPCIIFRPKNIRVAEGSAYIASVSGLKTIDGQDAPIEYFVAFFDLRKAMR